MKLTKLIILSLILISVTLNTPPISMAQDYIIKGGWYFDSINGHVVKNTNIVVSGGKFFEVNTPIYERDMSSFETITLSNDEYILPGLFDIHAHYNMDLLGKGRRDEYEVNPVIFLANGVTSTFPAGEFNPVEMMQARKEIDRGERPGPRLFSSGPYFGPARIGWDKNISDEDLRAEIDYWVEQGAKGLKAKRISPKHLKILLERAHYHGVTVTGHLDSGYNDTINPKDAILMGIDRIEHFLGGDALDPTVSAYTTLVDFKPGTEEFNDIVSLYLRYNVYFDATINAYGYFADRTPGFDTWQDETRFYTPYVKSVLKSLPPKESMKQFQRIFEIKHKTLKAFYDAGGGKLLTLGTDQPGRGDFLPGFSAHRELEAFVRSGIPNFAALQSATINSANAFNIGNKLGSIEPGKFADLFIIKGNPLEDIKNTRNILKVMRSGRLYDPAKLLKSVEGMMGPKNADEAKNWK